MRLFIAEKPELGRAIVEALDGKATAEKGYITKGDNIVSWAFGHIMELAEPESYNKSYEKWNFNDLPLNLPINSLKRLPKSTAKEQLKIIVGLINQNNVNEIIHCGDADEEGQILIDEILTYSKTNKPILRCLINDITPKAIQKAIQTMKPNAEYRGLSNSGFARSEADYLVGMNFTRFYTLLNQRNGGSGVISVGRVQTPILALIVNRELENKNFKSLEYYAISALFDIGGKEIKAELKLDKDDKITDKDIAESIKSKLNNQNFAFSMTCSDKKEYPPLPFNLLQLQALASKLYGFSAKQTLDITQDLREKYKAITYNRSDCEYLPNSAFEDSPLIVDNLKKILQEDLGQNNANLSIKSKAFDDSKISAHYAIIPTQANFDINKLNNNEKLIYHLIAQRFLMQFYEPCDYKSYSLKFVSGEYEFGTTIRQNTKLGFKAFFGKNDKDDDEDAENVASFDLASLSNHNSALCKEILINPTKTKPRPLYTMTTLLKDLNSVGKYVKDERIKKLLIEKDKDKKGENGGIGTPATRSAHIETLIKRGYISVSKDKKQSIKVNDIGFNLIQNLPQILTGVDMTALWFEQQKEIQSLVLSKNAFLQEIQDFITNLINENKEKNMSFGGNNGNNAGNSTNNSGIQCPKCGNGFLREVNGKFGKFFSCSEYKNGCDFKAKSVNGKPDLSPKKEVATSEYDCPKCGKGKLIRRESKKTKGNFWYGCSEFRNGCDFSCFEKDGKPDLQ